ncbi:hypothetical protein DICSQDRAFT_82843 [Dichomitus squalens LYAD-421 SS1]|uniref:GST N-terminal domain-containing protein n=1 Tax=Dichomitus squalens TaxID=114155 RepID=A0A4Q9PWC4_9APHY|nr:uncharacterized protein DICSQDRAFT_82843 [Dichomitus squalens LYAD-421 SS1]EJF63317.1 hypothetical protein DICSQDRAFT_82843 [Dichomitus squalens LYAD-421 SS1]TBU58972.1 hypothetical protein BD310DRAFT_877802 [Dichomitus squalens]
MSEPIIFYDLPSIENIGTWSPFTLRTRYSLNIKGIPYKTVWVEYPDIAPLSKQIGAAPTGTGADGAPLYTLPMIYDPNTKTAVSDSGKIARYLDKTYPDTHKLIPAELDVFTAAFEDAFWGAFHRPDLVPVMNLAVFDILPPRSQSYFRRAREATFGTTMEDLAPLGSEKRANHWAKVRNDASKVAAWYEADGNKDKTFVLGDNAGVTYADVIVTAFFGCFRKGLGEDSQEWKDIAAWDGGRWKRLLAAFEKYGAVDAGEELKLQL